MLSSPFYPCCAGRALAVAMPLVASAQPPPVPPPLPEAGATSFTIFLRGAPIGSEQIARQPHARPAGRSSAPGASARRSTSSRAGCRCATRPTGGRSSSRSTAPSAGSRRRFAPSSKAPPRRAQIVVAGQTTREDRHHRPERAAAAAEQLLRSVRSARGPAEDGRGRHRDPGVSACRRSSITVRVGESSAEQIQTTCASGHRARRTRIALMLPGAQLDADLWTDDTGRMIRFSVPPQSLEVVREDVAVGVLAQRDDLPAERRTDEASRATASCWPARCRGRRRHEPAAKLPGRRAWSAAAVRPIATAWSFGIPILGQIAGALADAGFIVVRYDKRGIGQSGGRAEVGVAGGLRRGRARGRQDAGRPEGRRSEAHRRRSATARAASSR